MWFQIRTIYYLVRLAKNPGNYPLIIKFRTLLYRHGYFRAVLEQIGRWPENVKTLEERPTFDAKDIHMDELAALPEGTLGRAYADFMRANGLTPLPHMVSGTTDEDYVHYRLVVTHDLWHVFHGFGTDVCDEMKIQAFMLCQLRWPSSGFFLGGILMRQMFQKPREIGDFIEAIIEGWTRGKTTSPLFAVRWDKEWNTPLNELRARLMRAPMASAVSLSL
jgi:ubiquinone biosynthesis protein Coq4